MRLALSVLCAAGLTALATPGAVGGLGIVAPPAPEGSALPWVSPSPNSGVCPVVVEGVPKEGGPLQILEIGAMVYCTDAWGGRGFEYWAAHLHRAGRVPTLKEVLDADWVSETSSWFAEPVAGALVLYLSTLWGRGSAGERLLAWRPGEAELDSLESGWSFFLDALLRSFRGVIEEERDRAARFRTGEPATIKGVNFSHEGYGGFDGYLSLRSDASLERLAELGANGVAILPYAFLADPARPAPIEPPVRPGSETDQAVVHAVRSAQDLGLTVLLKPHIWVRGSWPGEIRMSSARDWDRFFSYYERWIEHYALMAEIHGVPILSVGVELSGAVPGQEERWVALVERLRLVYSGALVYAANWGEEFEGLSFWDAFDYIGVDAYYPLSDDPDASDTELEAGARNMIARLETVHRRHDVPLLLTEIGFASTRGAWIRPWEGHRSQERSERDQFRSYRAVLAALEGHDWIHGAFWWKWPSDPRRAERFPRGFKPIGKAAEVLLGEWFRGEPSSSWPRWSELAPSTED